MESAGEGDPAKKPDPSSLGMPHSLYIVIPEAKCDWENNPGTARIVGNNGQSMEDVRSPATLPASQTIIASSSTMTQPGEITGIEYHADKMDSATGGAAFPGHSEDVANEDSLIQNTAQRTSESSIMIKPVIVHGQTVAFYLDTRNTDELVRDGGNGLNEDETMSHDSNETARIFFRDLKRARNEDTDDHGDTNETAGPAEKKKRPGGKGKAHLFTRMKKKTVSKAKGLLRSKRISVNQQTYKRATPSATCVYTEAEIAELKLQITRKCPYCQHEASRRPELKSHALNKCPGLRQDPNVVKVLQMCAGSENNIITATECNYEASPMDGLVYFCCLQYPEGVFVAPFNWLFVIMDPNRRTKGQSRVRRTALAHQYQHIKTKKLLRTRRYTDRSNHIQWEKGIREKIVNNEVKTLVIPTCFFYQNANIFSSLQNRNHCALLVLTFKDGRVQKCIYYESLEDERFHKQVSSRAVTKFIQINILSSLTLPQPKLQTYKSLAVDGCQGVLCYFLHQIYSGLEVCDPPNVDILNAWKTMLFHCPQSDLLEGDKFDLQWKLKKKKNGRKFDPDPEMDKHNDKFRSMINSILKK